MAAESGPSCKSKAEFNFGPASGLDQVVWGAARPGAASQRCFSPTDVVQDNEVLAYAEFLKSKGVGRVVGLLTDSELQTYATPPSQLLSQAGLHAVNVSLEGTDPALAMKQVEQELRAAEEAGEKVVVHCWGGGGRTAKVLGAWLVQRHGLDAEAAATEVTQTASAHGTTRRVDAASVQALLG